MSRRAFIPKSRREQLVEAAFQRTIPELLQDMYHEKGWPQEEIAAHLGVSRSTVIDWMRRYDIPTGYNRRPVTAA